MQGTPVKFESPVHDYNAVEFTANRRFADWWALAASYRWSRLTGNFEGFFRNDNGQSDSGDSSLYDYPTDDPMYTLVGVPVFGYSGDIRFLGSKGDGPLPLDRTHDVKAYGTYLFDFGLSLSAGVEVESGAPLTALAAHPIYGGGGEIPLDAPRGRLPDVRRLPHEGALDEAGEPRRGVYAQGRRRKPHAPRRRVQRVQHADRGGLRRLFRNRVHRAEPSTSARRARPACSAASSSRHRGSFGVGVRYEF